MLKSTLVLLASSAISTVAASAVGSLAGLGLLEGGLASPAVNNQSLARRQGGQCQISTYHQCPNDPEHCAKPGHYCCDNSPYTCPEGSWCMPDARTLRACCPDGKKCDGTDPEDQTQYYTYRTTSRALATRTSTETLTSTTTQAVEVTSTKIVTLGTSTRVLVDLETQVEWIGTWIWYAYAYGWCAIWGPSGRRIEASASAIGMATIDFAPDVQAVALSIVVSDESKYTYEIDGLMWEEEVSARASASVGPDGSVSASAQCKWTNKFKLKDEWKATPGTNTLMLNVKSSMGIITDSKAWIQINAIQGFASVQDMEAEVSGTLSATGPAATVTGGIDRQDNGPDGAPTEAPSRAAGNFTTLGPTAIPTFSPDDVKINSPPPASQAVPLVPSSILAVSVLALLLFL